MQYRRLATHTGPDHVPGGSVLEWGLVGPMRSVGVPSARRPARADKPI